MDKNSNNNDKRKLPQVLLVEDHHIVQMVSKQQFERFGCAVDIAPNAASVMPLFQSKLYDLVIMDLGLPDGDGCSLAEQIREWGETHGGYTPVIALTAHADVVKKQECLAAGMELVLIKPLSIEMAERVFNRFLNKNL